MPLLSAPLMFALEQGPLFHGLQSAFPDLEKFEDELKTMKQLHSIHPMQQKIIEEMNMAWLNSIKKDGDDTSDDDGAHSENLEVEDYDELVSNSRRLREEGNRLFNANGKKRNLLGACNLYTQAIFAAPAESQALAVAYANRAAALQEFGYFMQAYDNCVIALELPYPEQLRHKVVIRQAKCALHLEKTAQLQHHLTELEALTLNESFTKEVAEMHVKLQILKQSIKTTMQENIGEKKETLSSDEEKPAKGDTFLKNKTKVITSQGPAGRYLIAAQTIQPNEIVFSDYATTFVTTNIVQLCEHCAAIQLVPIPCKGCRGRIVFCSLKCRDAHKPIHVYECAGHRRNIFSQVGLGYIALRTLINGLPHVIPMLRSKHNAQTMWKALIGDNQNDHNNNADSISANKAAEYSQVLRMVHHLKSSECEEVELFAFIANLMLLYLKKFTDFFKLTEGSTASRRDWELLSSALLLRHIGQYHVNGYTIKSLVPIDHKLQKFTLLRDELWTSPWHLKKGRLHQFQSYNVIGFGIFPHASFCNHSCERLFEERFCGRHITVLALGEVSAGREITSCYTEDNLQSKRQSRRNYLQKKHNFECECVKCEKANPDAEYKEFHRYRCEQPKCRKVFVPHLPNLETLNWWRNDNKDLQIKCTVCGEIQRFEWLLKIQNLQKNIRNPAKRRLLYKNIIDLNQYLIEKHEFRMVLSMDVVCACFELHCGGLHLADEEFEKLIEILKYSLSTLAAICGDYSIQYASKLTFLWDLIALDKYKCSRDEMQRMLQSVEIFSDEYKIIFLNYYEDYLKPLLPIEE